MKTTTRNIVLGCVLALGLGHAAAEDKDDAATAARQILETLQTRHYEQLWDSQTSAFFQSKIDKDVFIDNLTVGRSRLGAAGESAFMQMTTASSDAATGYVGPIYAFSYRNAYEAGVFLERIVVVQDEDGVFRMSGLWAAPLPEQPAAAQ